MATKEMNCLESILIEFFNKGRKTKIFSKRVKRDEEGNVVKCFVQNGAEIYNDFVDLNYLLGEWFETVEDLENYLKSLKNIGITSNMKFSDVIDETDNICTEG